MLIYYTAIIILQNYLDLQSSALIEEDVMVFVYIFTNIVQPLCSLQFNFILKYPCRFFDILFQNGQIMLAPQNIAHFESLS